MGVITIILSVVGLDLRMEVIDAFIIEIYFEKKIAGLKTKVLAGSEDGCYGPVNLAPSLFEPQTCKVSRRPVVILPTDICINIKCGEILAFDTDKRMDKDQDKTEDHYPQYKPGI